MGTSGTDAKRNDPVSSRAVAKEGTMAVSYSMRAVSSALVCATGFWLSAPETARAQSCSDTPRASFDVREDPFNQSAEERNEIVDTVYTFALTWDLRDEVNLPLLFIDGGPEDGLLF